MKICFILLLAISIDYLVIPSTEGQRSPYPIGLTFNHIYFLTVPFQDVTQNLLQKAQMMNLYNGQIVTFRTFVVQPNATYTLSVYDEEGVMFYAVQATLDPINGLTNALFAFPINSTTATSLYCSFTDNNLLENPIIAFTKGNFSGFAFLLSTIDSDVYLYRVELFGRSFVTGGSCNTTLLAHYDTSNITTENLSEEGTILGAAVDIVHQRYAILHSIFGLVYFVYGNEPYAFLIGLNSSYVPVSLATNIDPTTGDLFMNQFLVSGNTTHIPTPIFQPVLSRMNETSLQFKDLCTIPQYGTLAYDPLNQIFFVQSNLGTSLTLFSYTGYFLGNFSVGKQLQQIHYYSHETPFCPNGCNNNGACTSTGCNCYYAWLPEDCSQCDSTVFCSGHGICEVANVNNRTCSCVPGWEGPSCSSCNSDILCSGHGTCSPNTITGQCTCNSGFSGSDCSVCDSRILCNGHGSCTTNGTCDCDPYWGELYCTEFVIPSKYDLSETIMILNIVTLGLWGFLLILALLGLFFEGHAVGKLARKVIAPVTFKGATVFIQSFALLMSNSNVSYFFTGSFRLYYFFIFDFDSGLHLSNTTIWSESAAFLPKCVMFIIGCILWRSIKNLKVRGIILQIGLWSYFVLVISLALRFKDVCVVCGRALYIVEVLLSLGILATLFYMDYRIWRLITRNRHYFETDSDYETNIFIEAKPPTWFAWLSVVLSVVCHPPSTILGTFFSRLCSEADKGVRRPPISSERQEGRPSKYTPESSVEEFLQYIVRKIDKEDLDISRIVAMLKGNWFTTVADLRNLTEMDAEKLNIPLRLFHAIQEELPKQEAPQVYTRINTLVKTEQKDKFLTLFGRLAEDFKITHILTKLDELVCRNFIWVIVYVALWQIPDWQLIVVLVIQTWYTIYLAWQRPYNSNIDLIGVLIPEVGLVFVIGLLIHLEVYYDHFIVLLIIPIINVLSILGTFVPYIMYNIYAPGGATVDDQAPLLKNSDLEHKSYSATERTSINPVNSTRSSLNLTNSPRTSVNLTK